MKIPTLVCAIEPIVINQIVKTDLKSGIHLCGYKILQVHMSLVLIG